MTKPPAETDMSDVLWSTEFHPQIQWDSLEAIHRDRIHRVQQAPDSAFLLVSSPTPTFTFGPFSRREDCLWDEAQCRSEGVEIRAVNRGGRWTYHGPGQVVLYPIFPLERLGRGRRAVLHYANLLRSAIQETVRQWGIAVTPDERPFGLYVEQKKIASFGIAVTEGVTSHGVAVYLEDQSRYFSGINPCGAPSGLSTSLKQAGYRGDWGSTAAALADAVKKSLNRG